MPSNSDKEQEAKDVLIVDVGGDRLEKDIPPSPLPIPPPFVTPPPLPPPPSPHPPLKKAFRLDVYFSFSLRVVKKTKKILLKIKDLYVRK